MKLKKYMHAAIGMGLMMSGFAFNVQANNRVLGGVSLGVTRVIYPIEAKQMSLPVINHSQQDRYLINAWIENEQEKKTKDFLITPPLFVAEADTENTLRIVNVAADLPQDRESVFWINVKAIPSVDKASLENKNLLQLAVLSRIKLFVRPSKMPYLPETALERISFANTANGVEVNNNSAYHVSFVNVLVDDKKQHNRMAAPFSKTKLAETRGKKISYQTVNDFGGLTPKVEVLLP